MLFDKYITSLHNCQVCHVTSLLIYAVLKKSCTFFIDQLFPVIQIASCYTTEPALRSLPSHLPLPCLLCETMISIDSNSHRILNIVTYANSCLCMHPVCITFLRRLNIKINFITIPCLFKIFFSGTL